VHVATTIDGAAYVGQVERRPKRCSAAAFPKVF